MRFIWHSATWPQPKLKIRLIASGATAGKRALSSATHHDETFAWRQEFYGEWHEGAGDAGIAESGVVYRVFGGTWIQVGEAEEIRRIRMLADRYAALDSSVEQERFLAVLDERDRQNLMTTAFLREEAAREKVFCDRSRTSLGLR